MNSLLRMPDEEIWAGVEKLKAVIKVINNSLLKRFTSLVKAVGGIPNARVHKSKDKN